MNAVEMQTHTSYLLPRFCSLWIVNQHIKTVNKMIFVWRKLWSNEPSTREKPKLAFPAQTVESTSHIAKAKHTHDGFQFMWKKLCIFYFFRRDRNKEYLQLVWLMCMCGLNTLTWKPLTFFWVCIYWSKAFFSLKCLHVTPESDLNWIKQTLGSTRHGECGALLPRLTWDCGVSVSFAGTVRANRHARVVRRLKL